MNSHSITQFEFKTPYYECPICGAPGLEYAFTSHSAYLCIEGFQISKCCNCGLHLCNPQSTDESLEAFYKHQMELENSEELCSASLARYFDLERKRKFISQRLIP